MSCSLRKSTPPQSVVVCNDSAFIDLSEYTVKAPASRDDKEFHKWANTIITKQPTLIGAYADLRECWEYYHGKKND